jgi:hypothetical protein
MRKLSRRFIAWKCQEVAKGCRLVRCSRVVSNLRYTGHQINVSSRQPAMRGNGSGLIPPSPSAARQPVKTSVQRY